MHRPSANRLPVLIVGSLIALAFSNMAAKRDAITQRYLSKDEWVPPKFHINQNPPERKQGDRECARRVRQLAAGIIHLN